ncbi:S-layer homology domain-containing protein [Peptoniphilus sp.]|uniref:S-layer homology domain-containing protein n=1 Tax=Peptoniphilus sp. TaxID=1971214 RepID=UPI003995AEA9
MFEHKTKGFFKSMSLILIFILSISQFAFAETYKDIESHWSKPYVTQGIEEGWIKGYEDETIRPNDKITRSEFISILSRILNLDRFNLKTSSEYSDLDTEAWSKSSIESAESVGLLKFTFTEPYLNPSKEITHEEAANLLEYSLLLDNFEKNGSSLNDELISTALELFESQIELKSDNGLLKYSDRDKVNSKFVFSIWDLTDKKIISGNSENLFNPEGSLSRGEAMTLLVRAFKGIPKEPSLDEAHVVSVDGKYYLEDKTNGLRFSPSKFKDGIVKVADKTYLLNADGSLGQGFIDKNNKTYYVDGENGLATGWRKIDNALYYFSPYDYRMYKDGMFSTGKGVYWFGKDGKLETGNRPGGIKGRLVYWAGPSDKELSNEWLTGDDKELRFRGQEIANFAASYEGLPFKWYGFDLTNGEGVYCVGNAYSAHKAFGIKIPGANDANIKLHNGYELTRVQYVDAEKFGGIRYPADFSKAWPGDLIFNYSPNFYLGYNHVGIFMGHNNNRPIYVHATLADGLFVGDCREMNWRIGRKFNDCFIRYNTEANFKK